MRTTRKGVVHLPVAGEGDRPVVAHPGIVSCLSRGLTKLWTAAYALLDNSGRWSAAEDAYVLQFLGEGLLLRLGMPLPVASRERLLCARVQLQHQVVAMEGSDSTLHRDYTLL